MAIDKKTGYGYGTIEEVISYKKKCLEQLKSTVSTCKSIGLVYDIGILYLGVRALAALYGMCQITYTGEINNMDLLATFSAGIGGVGKVCLMQAKSELKKAQKFLELALNKEEDIKKCPELSKKQYNSNLEELSE